MSPLHGARLRKSAAGISGHRWRAADQPVGGEFQTFHSAERAFAGADPAAFARGHATWNRFWRVVALSRPKSRIDRQRFYSGGGFIDHDLPHLVETIRHARREHSAKQHRADRRFGRRIDRLRARRHHAGYSDSRIRSRNRARHARVGPGRLVRHFDDDPATPRDDCRSTRDPEISRGHRLCRSVESGGGQGIPRCRGQDANDHRRQNRERRSGRRRQNYLQWVRPRLDLLRN